MEDEDLNHMLDIRPYGRLRTSADFCGPLPTTADYCGLLRTSADFCGLLRTCDHCSPG